MHDARRPRSSCSRPRRARLKQEGRDRRRVATARCRSSAPRRSPTVARKALEYIDPENLILSSDCGFGRQGAGRTVAFYKAAAIAQGANIIRRELGLPETYVPVADEMLAPDVVPARFEP